MVARREKWGEGKVRDFGMDQYTLLYLKWITNRDLLYSTGNSAYVAAWMDEESGGEWTQVYAWLSLSAVHLHCHNIAFFFFCHNIANQLYSDTK